MYQSNNITAFKTTLNVMLFIFVYKIKTKNQSKYFYPEYDSVSKIARKSKKTFIQMYNEIVFACKSKNTVQ